MRLEVFPPDEMIEKTLNNLYEFNSTCGIRLDVTFSSAIVCNSNQNSDKKALSNFPTSYLKMQVMKPNLAYSYYIDLGDTLDKNDVEGGFARMKKDLILE